MLVQPTPLHWKLDLHRHSGTVPGVSKRRVASHQSSQQLFINRLIRSTWGIVPPPSAWIHTANTPSASIQTKPCSMWPRTDFTKSSPVNASLWLRCFRNSERVILAITTIIITATMVISMIKTRSRPFRTRLKIVAESSVLHSPTLWSASMKKMNTTRATIQRVRSRRSRQPLSQKATKTGSSCTSWSLSSTLRFQSNKCVWRPNRYTSYRTKCKCSIPL